MRPNTEYSEATRLVASDAEREPAWYTYARYCRERGLGLRKQALGNLETFVAAAERWPFEARLSFVAWLCAHLERPGWARFDLTPHPLTNRLLGPTLLEWTARDPRAPLPHRWLGMFFGYGHPGIRAALVEPPGSVEHHLRRAIELAPTEQPARVRLAELLIGGLEYAAHHLPEYYIGEAENDVGVAEEAAHLIEAITDPGDRARLCGELAAARQLLEDWLAFGQERGTDFDGWCRLRGRRYTWRKHYHYGGGHFDTLD
jgi:hypothetical protein